MEPQDIFDRFCRLMEKAKTAVADVRLDVADEAERLALDACAVFNERPIGDVHAVLRLIGEKSVDIANTARSRI